MQWRNTALYPKLGPIDGRCFIPCIAALVPIAKWKVILAAILLVFFVILERRNITLEVFLRMVRSRIAGRYRKKMSPRIWRRRCREY
jgi:hypothetical protein